MGLLIEVHCFAYPLQWNSCCIGGALFQFHRKPLTGIPHFDSPTINATWRTDWYNNVTCLDFTFLGHRWRVVRVSVLGRIMSQFCYGGTMQMP